MTSRGQANQGITLVALVITVIIMLILAGVAISMTVGENGIFKKSKEGAEIYKNSANNEAIGLNHADKQMGELMNQYQGGSVPQEKPGKPNAQGIFTENSTINGGKASAFNPSIPKGFMPKDEETTQWGNGTNPPSEEAVKEGLIIEDEEGNQFVWIAVDGTEVTLGRYIFTATGEIDTTLSKTEPKEQLKASSSEIHYYTEGLKEDTTSNTHAIDIEAFRRSVAEYGGYYIARYEASYGMDGKPNSKVSTGSPITVSATPTMEGQLWNNVTQASAATASRNMYDSSYGVTSDLMNGYAWDTAILFIQKYSDDNNYARKTTLNTVLNNTGTNQDEKCHIHDMASNCAEWTTELYSDVATPCVDRGGYFSNTGMYTSGHIVNNTTIADISIGFRVVLYFNANEKN